MGKDYYVFSNGRIKRKDNTIYFVDPDDRKRALPIEDTERLHIFGEVDLNTKFINYISQSGVLLNFYNYYGFYSGTYYPRKKNISGLLNVKQAIHYSVYDERMYIAKAFIESSIHHIKRNLSRHNIPSEVFESMNKEKENAKNSKSIEELMGAEGRIRRIYYSAFKYIVKEEFHIHKREKRPPTDPINALISFGNSLMYTAALGEMYKTQLDPTISFLHEPSTKRFSLVLDITEIFKPLVVDSLIFSMINKNMIKLEDFSYLDGICLLNDSGRKKFIREFEKKMDVTVNHRALNRKVSYRTFIKLECYKLIKHFIDDEKYRPLKAWW